MTWQSSPQLPACHERLAEASLFRIGTECRDAGAGRTLNRGARPQMQGLRDRVNANRAALNARPHRRSCRCPYRIARIVTVASGPRKPPDGTRRTIARRAINMMRRSGQASQARQQGRATQARAHRLAYRAADLDQQVGSWISMKDLPEPMFLRRVGYVQLSARAAGNHVVMQGNVTTEPSKTAS